MRRNVIAAIAAVAILSIAGVGFAITYSGTVSTTSNVDYDGYTINILNDAGTQVSSEITFRGPDYTAPAAEPGETERIFSNESHATLQTPDATISGYKLSLNKNMTVTAMIIMNDDRSWWVVESITISVYRDANRTQLNGTYTWDPTTAAASAEQWASWTDSGDVVWTQGVQSLNLTATDANALTVEIRYRTDSIAVNESADNPDGLFDMGGKIVFTGKEPPTS